MYMMSSLFLLTSCCAVTGQAWCCDNTAHALYIQMCVCVCVCYIYSSIGIYTKLYKMHIPSGLLVISGHCNFDPNTYILHSFLVRLSCIEVQTTADMYIQTIKYDVHYSIYIAMRAWANTPLHSAVKTCSCSLVTCM